jgi:hypothetical protein
MTLLSIFANISRNNGLIDSNPSANVLDKVDGFLNTLSVKIYDLSCGPGVHMIPSLELTIS